MNWNLRDLSRLPPDEVSLLNAALSPLRMLDEVMRWAFANGLSLKDVIGHDEFTQDVVLQRPDGRALVFDCT